MDNKEQHQQQQQNVNCNNLPENQAQSERILKDETSSRKSKAYVKITEQPASKALRFRYECEGRSAGSIPGVNSTPENKTFPTIEIIGYTGRAVVVVSCVTKDFPYRPHPHSLVGKDGCKKGVCTMEINSDTMRMVFSNLGIQCVKKKDIEMALKAREEIRVDPFKTGFAHRFQPSSIDLNSVRLCFQVFTESEHKGRFTQPLPPIVSEPIYDKKAMSDLVICRLSSCTSSVLGNNKIILLCEKVAKDDIQVRFYEEMYGQLIWEAYGDFQQNDVHKQAAITFKTPRYHSIEITEPVKVFIQLKRPSDGMTSEPLTFEYVPLDSGRHHFWNIHRNLKRKPDLDLFQQILSINRDSEEVIDFNNSTMEQPKNHDNNYGTEKCLTKSIDNMKTIMTNDDIQQNAETIENDITTPMVAEIDSIIAEKVREMEQQQQTQENQDQVNTLNEVVELINENSVKPLTNELNDSNIMVDVPQFSATDKINEWMKSYEFRTSQDSTHIGSIDAVTQNEDKTLNELLDQVAELDEIYADRVVKRDDYSSTLLNELNGMEACITADTNTALNDGRQTSVELDNDSFDDAATYTSLQIAFKNPVGMPMEELMSMETVSSNNLFFNGQIEVGIDSQIPPRPPPPLTKVDTPSMIITGTDEEKVPPLPPKRLRKQDSDAENRSLEANIEDTTDRKQKQLLPPIIIMKTPDQLPSPNKQLSPKAQAVSCNTLPKPKKPGFFTKLFSRRKSKSDLNRPLESPTATKMSSKTSSPTLDQDFSVANFNNTDSNRSSVRSVQSLQPTCPTTSPINSPKSSQHLGKPVGRSSSSVSGKRPTHLNPNVIHIPLKGDSVHSLPQNEEYSQASTLTLSNIIDRKTASALQLADVPLCEGNMELIAIADRQSLRNLCEGEFNVHLDPNVDLTEAEHYALYTSIPPQATVSEFDETSAYYAPIEAGEILTPDQVAERLIAANHAAHLKRKRQKTNDDNSCTVDCPKIEQGQMLRTNAQQPIEGLSKWKEASEQYAKRNAKEHRVGLNVTKNELTAISLQPFAGQQLLPPYGLPTSPAQSVSPNTWHNHVDFPPYNIGHDPKQFVKSPTVSTTQAVAASVNFNDYLSMHSPLHHHDIDNYIRNQRYHKYPANAMAHKSQAFTNGSQAALDNLFPQEVEAHSPYHMNWNQSPSALAEVPRNTSIEPNIGPIDASNHETNAEVNNNNNNSYNEHGLTNLIQINSKEFVHINTEDQEKILLRTDDLQISSLSISS